MSRTIEVTDQSKEYRWTPRAKKAAATLALLGAGVAGVGAAYGVGKVEGHIKHNNEVNEMIHHPEDLTQGSYIERQVAPGQTATDIAAKYATTQEHFEDIREQVQTQAGEDGILDQGQEVRISNAFIDEMPETH